MFHSRYRQGNPAVKQDPEPVKEPAVAKPGEEQEQEQPAEPENCLEPEPEKPGKVGPVEEPGKLDPVEEKPEELGHAKPEELGHAKDSKEEPDDTIDGGEMDEGEGWAQMVADISDMELEAIIEAADRAARRYS